MSRRGTDQTFLTDSEHVVPSPNIGSIVPVRFPGVSYQTFRDHATLLSGVIAFKERPVGIGTERSAERAWAMMVTANYFDVLGVKPVVGRVFEGDELSDAPDAHPVAVLGHTMWQARFHADTSVIGRTLLLNKQPYTIIGVAPEGFFGTISGLRFDVFVPLTMHASLTGSNGLLTNRRNRPLSLFARLTDGVTIEQAQADMTHLAAATAAERPDSNLGISAALLPAAHARRGAQHDLKPLLEIDGYVPRAGESMKICRNLVGPGYFGLMGIRLLDGRDFTDLDTRESPFVAVVNQTFARRYFGGGGVIGRRFTGWDRPITVVGIAADSKYHELSEAPQPYFYAPLRQLFNASTGVAVHVRTAGDPLAAAPAVRQVLRGSIRPCPTTSSRRSPRT